MVQVIAFLIGWFAVSVPIGVLLGKWLKHLDTRP